MTSSTPKLYHFEGSVWANAPKLAISESDYKKGDVEFVRIDLAEGENFSPDYLKINPKGTVPTLFVDGQTFTDSTTVVNEILRRAPHPPPSSAHTSTSIIEEIHADAHDPNATLLFAINDEDREAKKNGITGAFLAGRQKALDKFAASAPEEFKQFLTKKQASNRQLLEFYTGNPDKEARDAHYATAASLWKSVGIVTRGVVTQAIQKNKGPFAGGLNPSEVDFHIIAWLARTISNTGIEPGSPSSVALPKLQEYTGGHSFDPIVGKYWDAWIKRDSFKANHIQ